MVNKPARRYQDGQRVSFMHNAAHWVPNGGYVTTTDRDVGKIEFALWGNQTNIDGGLVTGWIYFIKDGGDPHGHFCRVCEEDICR